MIVFQSVKENLFLYQELVKRDFKKKYKRSILGIGWSVLSPLLTLLVMRMVFTRFFGRDTPNYTTYLFAGNIFFSFFRDATKNGMKALAANRKIISKINMPKYAFLLSQNASSVVTLLLTMLVFFCLR